LLAKIFAVSNIKTSLSVVATLTKSSLKENFACIIEKSRQLIIDFKMGINAPSISTGSISQTSNASSPPSNIGSIFSSLRTRKIPPTIYSK
jgi:hypothetical protein